MAAIKDGLVTRGRTMPVILVWLRLSTYRHRGSPPLLLPEGFASPASRALHTFDFLIQPEGQSEPSRTDEADMLTLLGSR